MRRSAPHGSSTPKDAVVTRVAGDPGASRAGNLAAVVHPWTRLSPRGVIFDFNGTLSDDEAILQEIFTDLFAVHLGWHLTAEEYFARLAGHSDREIVEIAVAEKADGDAALTEQLLWLRRDRYQEMVAGDSPVGPGALALVERLSDEGVPMAIVTGAQRQDVECVLAASPVGRHLRTMVTEEDVGRGKPDPEGFLKGAALLDLPPERILVFEDSVPGVLGARAAGMPCVAVRGQHGSNRLPEVAAAVVPALGPAILDAVG